MEILSLTTSNLSKWHETVSLPATARTKTAKTSSNHDRSSTADTERRALGLYDSVGVLPETHGQKCVLCWKSVSVIGLLPCGHIVLCSRCGRDCLPAACPMCGSVVQSALRYMTAEQALKKAAQDEARCREMMFRKVRAQWMNKGVAQCLGAWSKLAAEEVRKRELCKRLLQRIINLSTVRVTEGKGREGGRER